MEDQDFLTRKYEYDSIQKLNLEILLKEENNKFLRTKENVDKKNKNFEKIRQEFIENKNISEKDIKTNLEFLQKRIIDKSNDLEKNKKLLCELNIKKEKLFLELNKSNKSLEIIYKKIEDIALNKKIQKENISEADTIEKLLVNKNSKKEDEPSITSSDDKDFIDPTFSNNLCDESTQNDFYLKNEVNLTTTFDFNDGGQGKHEQYQECYMSFEKFKDRIDNFKAQSTPDSKSLTLEYQSESGALYSIDLSENVTLIDINISINSYKDYLNLKKERMQIISSLKERGISVKNINLRQRALI